MRPSFVSAPPAARPCPGSTQATLRHYAPAARYANFVLLAFCLLLALDWALPVRRYEREAVLSRLVVLTSSSASDPRMAYDIVTPHARFRIPSEQGARVRDEDRVTVWITPLLGVVRQVSAPTSPEGATPFRPANGTIYGPFALAPLLLLAVALVGAWPGRSPETRMNTAVAGVLLALVTLGILIWV
ncbi:hypothetical protein [Hymenobacter edaphi]|uniref:hypothetical protein n=1 Tax=Hymenobacter edaphi TaxID=2211146 RepID=UPI001A9DEE41|nr:hypothetical protein [Hymenobacter edaphi]